MTKKLKQILVIFMAVFMFSCAEDPAGGGWTSSVDDDPDEIAPGNQGAFNAKLAEIRTAHGSINDIGFTTNGGFGNVTDLTELDNSYLVTKIGVNFVVLFIHKEIFKNYHNINMGSSSSVATAITEAGNNDYQDPRKILFKESFTDHRGNGGTVERVRMTWAGRFGGAIEGGNTFSDIKDYDSLASVKYATGGTFGVGAVEDKYDIIYYENQVYQKDGSSVSVSNARVAFLATGVPFSSIVNNGKNAWGWSLITPSNQEIWSSPANITLFGSGARGRFLYGTFDSKTPYGTTLTFVSELNNGGDVNLLNSRNNFTPPGKAILGRRDRYTGFNDVALLLSPIVGYNIKTTEADSTLLNALYSDPGKIKSARYVYMEFDSGTAQDAVNDKMIVQGTEVPAYGDGNGTEDAFGFKPNGVSPADARPVHKFTGILLSL